MIANWRESEVLPVWLFGGLVSVYSLHIRLTTAQVLDLFHRVRAGQSTKDVRR